MSLVNEVIQWAVLIFMLLLGIGLAREQRLRADRDDQTGDLIDLKEGDRLPRFYLKSPTGERWISDPANMEGESAFLFVSSKCAACQGVLSNLNAAIEQYAPGRALQLRVVALDHDTQLAMDAYRAYEYLFRYIWLSDNDHEPVQRVVGVHGTPTYAVVDPTVGLVKSSGFPSRENGGWAEFMSGWIKEGDWATFTKRQEQLSDSSVAQPA